MSTENKVFITPEGEHDYNKPYEQYSIVKHTQENNINVYLAIKPVPPFIKITDKNYWKFLKSDVGGSGDDEHKTIYVEKLIPLSPQYDLTSEQVESLNVGDLVITTTDPKTVYVCSQILQYDGYNYKALSSIAKEYSSIRAVEVSIDYYCYYNGQWVWANRYVLSTDYLAEKIGVRTQTQGSSGMFSNTLYNLGKLATDTTFVMAAATDNTIANVWMWTFSTGSTAPTITWPAEITMWSGGEAPEIEANKYYEVSVMNGVGTIISADISQEEETEVEP